MSKPLFEVLFQPGEAIEVRVVAPWCGSGFFDNAADLQAALEELDGLKPDGIYCSLNPVKHAVFLRSPNEFKAAKKGKKLAASKEDIACRRWVLIDVDPIRPKNVSATDAEKAVALAVARQVQEYLRGQGFPEMILCDSGNGYHLLLAVDLPNDENSTRLVRGFLTYLSAQFSTPGAKVDTVNFNPDRITKAYGTWARKGPNTPERPHRQSKVLALPTEVSPVSEDLLERMQCKKETAALLPDAGDIIERQIAKLREWADTVPGFPKIARLKREANKVTVIPEFCYLNPDHQGTSPGITFHADGGRGNSCKHEGCAMPFKAWWAEVEKVYGRKLGFEPDIVFGEKKRPWSIENYTRIRPEPIDWIFRGFLAKGKITLFSGEPGEGKSLVTVDWSARITTGRGWPNGDGIPPMSVLMFNTEDDPGDTIKPRFMLAGGDSSRLFHIQMPEGEGFLVDSPQHLAILRDALDRHQEIGLIVIDPISEHCAQEKEQDIRRGVAAFRELLSERNIACLLVNHFNKMSIKNLSGVPDKVGGAKAWVGLPRFVFAVQRDAEGKHHICRIKGNLGAHSSASQDFQIEARTLPDWPQIGEQPAIHWTGEGTATVGEILANKEAKGTKEGDCYSALKGLLKSEGQDAAELYSALTAAGFSERTIKRARDKMVLDGVMASPYRLPGQGNKWFWKRT